MSGKKGRKYLYRLLSIVVSVALFVTLLAPGTYVSAAAVPAFAKTSQSILAGDSYTIAIKNKIADAKYTWKSSDKSVATVTSKGVVKGVDKGTASISCTIRTSKKTYTLKCKVTVRKPATEVAISNKIDYLLVGETYDLNRRFTPSGANETVTWSSSDKSVISPDKNGLFQALKKGAATITVTTASKKTDSVTIYVVEEKSKVITKSNVVNGRVTLEKKSYGNLIISSSVGNAQINLDNIMVGGTLTMESGAAYTVVTKDSTINKVAAVNQMEIASFAEGDDTESETLTPSIVAESGSLIVSIDSECNISVKQTNGATIQSFSVVTSQDGSISIALEGFKGNLVIDSQAKSNIQIATTACEIASATVRNAAAGQAISLTDTKAGTEEASSIQSVILEANAALTVDVKAEELKVAGEVSQAGVTISQPVTKVVNEGSGTSLVINSRIQNLTVTGAGSNVSLNSGAAVNTVTATANNTTIVTAEGSEIKKVEAHGDHVSLEGKGKVIEAVVTGNDTSIGTAGTTVQVAKGTSNITVGGVEVKEEDKIVIAKPTPTPVPSATPRPTVTPKPSTTPTPSITPSPSPTPALPPVVNPPSGPGPSNPEPTNQEKLTAYNQVLGTLHNATAACLANNNQNNQTVVKNALNAVKSRLITYGNIDSGVTAVVLNDNYINDFADYFEHLVVNGSEYGLFIRQYYDSKAAGTATLDEAVKCANRALLLANRINTEKPVMEADITALFQSLNAAPQAFYTAISKLYSDFGDQVNFEAKDAATLQQLVKTNLLLNKAVRENYNLGSNRRLTFRSDILLFSEIKLICSKEQDLFKNKDNYKALVDAVLAKLPKITIWKWYNEADDTIRFDHVEYEPLNAEGEAAFIQAVQAVFDHVDLYYYFGSDVADEFIADPALAEFFVNTFSWIIGNFDYQEDNIIVSFHDYVYNYNSLSSVEQIQGIADALHHIIWATYNNQDWSNWYLKEYQTNVDAVITAAAANDAAALYNKVTALYQKKLAEEGMNEEWANYAQPSADMDKELLLQLVKQKLQPGSEIIDDKPANSNLYAYKAAAKKTGRLLDQVIYELKDIVTVCQAAKLEPLVKNFLEELPEGRWDNPEDIEHSNIVFDMPEDSAALTNALQAVFDTANSLKIIGSEKKDFIVDESYAYILVDRFANHILRHEDWNNPGGLSTYYTEYYNKNTSDPAKRGKVLYNCVDEITGITFDAAGWNNWFLKEYKGYADQIVDAAKNNNAILAYDALVGLFERRLADDGSHDEWAQYQPIPNSNDDTAIKECYLQNIKRWIAENDGSVIYRYAAGEAIINAYLVDGVMYDMREAYQEVVTANNNVSKYRPLLEQVIDSVLAYDETPDGEHSDLVYHAICTIFEETASDFDNNELPGLVINKDYIISFIHSLDWNIHNNSLYVQYQAERASGNINAYLVRDCVNDILWNIHGNQYWNSSVINRYKGIADGIIQAANSEDADGVLQGLLNLYDQKQNKDEFNDVRQDWQQFELPSEAHKNLFIELMKAKLSQTDNRLAGYYNGSDTSAEALEDAMYEIRDIVTDIQQQITGFYEEKELANTIIAALQNQDAQLLYLQLGNLCEYMNTHYEKNGALLGEIYAPLYMDMYLGWINNNEASPLVDYYNRYDEIQQSEISLNIMDLTRAALFHVNYLMEAEGRDEILHNDELYRMERRREKIQNVISNNSSEDTVKLAALSELIGFLSEDEALLNSYFGNGETLGLSALSENVTAYYDQIDMALSDTSSALYSYMDDMINYHGDGVTPELVEAVYVELIQIIINTNVNNLAGKISDNSMGKDIIEDTPDDAEINDGTNTDSNADNVTDPDTDTNVNDDTSTEAGAESGTEANPDTDIQTETEISSEA